MDRTKKNSKYLIKIRKIQGKTGYKKKNLTSAFPFTSSTTGYSSYAFS